MYQCLFKHYSRKGLDLLIEFSHRRVTNLLQELNETFLRVTSMLESSLLSEEEAAKQGKLQKGTGDQMPPTSHTLIDLVITISIYLSRLSYGSLFSIASVVIDRESLDPQLIKKAYKLI